jgi:hypothetical protein
MIGLLSKNLDLFQTAGDEDVNTTLTVEQVEEDLRDYHAYPRVLYIVVLSPDRIKSMIIKIVFVVFPAKYTASRRKNKNWLARNYDNVSKLYRLF